jgi:aspartate carbamoyltransferase catalytic subunit
MTLRWPLLGAADLDRASIDAVLALADDLRQGGRPPDHGGALVGLLFLEPSLRTRTGFAAAAARLGARSIEVLELRDGPRSSPEPWTDALRVLAGYVDVVVARPGAVLEHEQVTAACPRPLISGGGAGPRAEHPAQALVDLFAIQTLAPGARRVAVCGDPGMRAARSLIGVLDRSGLDLEVTVVSDPQYVAAAQDAGDRFRTVGGAEAEWGSFDIVYAAGMPHDSVPLEARDPLIVGERILAALPDDAVVLSPMPVIDEIAPEARADPRVAFLRQSDLGLWARMAILHLALETAPAS